MIFMLMRALSAAYVTVLEALAPRNPKWDRERKEHLEQESKCQWCGGTLQLQVHHVFPVHKFPELEMVRQHWITLCMDPEFQCHYRQGHKGISWLAYDPEIRQKCLARWEELSSGD